MIISTIRIDVITKKKFYILRKKGIQKPKSLGVYICTSFAPFSPFDPLISATVMMTGAMHSSMVQIDKVSSQPWSF